jgi:hypothetical protein
VALLKQQHQPRAARILRTARPAYGSLGQFHTFGFHQFYRGFHDRDYTTNLYVTGH